MSGFSEKCEGCGRKESDGVELGTSRFIWSFDNGHGERRTLCRQCDEALQRSVQNIDLVIELANPDIIELIRERKRQRQLAVAQAARGDGGGD